MQRDDFENTLGQGLKKWAEAGKPTLDLEALVRAQTGEAAAPAIPARRGRSRAWVRWTGSVAAAALLCGLMVTFPSWAGAAADWPLVGPVVTEIIMKDAGLKWAYDEGVIQGGFAEAKLGNQTVRILGVVANQTRTTVIYQIPDWPEPPAQMEHAQPVPGPDRLIGRWSRPAVTSPEVSIWEVAGHGVASWSSGAIWTPVGLVGTVNTYPLEQETAEISLVLSQGISSQDSEKVFLNFTITRSDLGSRQVAADPAAEQTVEDMTVRLESVNYTPAETLVRYSIIGRTFSGVFSYSNLDGTVYVEAGGERLGATNVNGQGLEYYATFPAVDGPATFTVPTLIRGAYAELVWPLEIGAAQTHKGITITLTDWEREGDQVAFEWSYDRKANVIVGIAGFEAIGANGQVYPLAVKTLSTSHGPELERRALETELPADFQLVAVRAREVGEVVQGPWVFDLPR